ncbi:uncharacterized mitochondrial protein AtMg00860-like [Miscanthus floridulus]|uniref:uncharacterized mitochondrial protein AtMg00860-like n=1 Tax=Miscanthus floridulus TaxID=154761 RepID=UPI00345A36D0
MTSVHYLGHVISAAGVALDQEKVVAVATWPQPGNMRALRGFLGLVGYYHRFIKDYGSVAALLTVLLKKEAFLWSPAAMDAFNALKNALSSAPVLQLPDCDKSFMVDCDASSSGFGVWVNKLFGYDFTIEYRLGTLNVGANALSWREVDDLLLHAITEPSFQLFDDLRHKQQLDDDLRVLRDSNVASRGEP